MVNMKMSAEEAKEATSCSPTDGPEYPYGLCIDLDDDALAKLGITELPAVGAKMTLHALAVVTRTGANTTQGQETENRVGLQITDLELAPASAPTAAARLYGA